jgi:hypothetical protein
MGGVGAHAGSAGESVRFFSPLALSPFSDFRALGLGKGMKRLDGLTALKDYRRYCEGPTYYPIYKI